MGAAAKTIRDELKGAHDMGKIQAAASDIQKVAASMREWFPQGSGTEAGVKTAAKPEIWSDPEGFSVARTRLVEQADKFADAVQSGEVAEIGPAFKALGQACGNCHDKFREKDD